MREHIRQILVPVATLLLSSAASASEPTIIWRSATTGAIAAPAPASETPATPPVTPIAVTYGGNRFAWGTKESVLIMPDVSGGSGQYVYALATATPLPAGLVFDSTTGIFSGHVQVVGDFQFSVLIRDAPTGAMTTAVARFVVVK
jgi:hypothetical protein